MTVTAPPTPGPTTPDRARVRADVRGTVQGVGFRPFAFRLAAELGLTGWVTNTPGGAVVEAEGPRAIIDEFLRRLRRDHPPACRIDALELAPVPPVGDTSFDIRPSATAGPVAVSVPPDLATCADCRREVFDSADRRFRYPFSSCTACGPRFSIVEAVPYDRARTTMRRFPLCPRCRAEYENPADRRFHAEPIACPDCGPRLELWRPDGAALAAGDDALGLAVEAVRAGRVVAVKGLGGFQLVCDARFAGAVAGLRRRKGREEKPFAVMVPDLSAAEACAEVSPAEARLLASPEAPIVLLRARRATGLAAGVAPGNPLLGVMLPYTPLHHLLLADLGFPVVATSGNRTDEPICTDEREALARLAGLADVFLVHDRPIARPVDDSVVRVVLGRELVLRRARGYAPLIVPANEPLPPLLAVGAHLKNTVAVAVAAPAGVGLSQHVGDLGSAEAHAAFRAAAVDLPALHGVHPVAVACDLHPDYASTRYAAETGLRVMPVQHHHAHVLACLADNGAAGPCLGVAWDGTGLGTDGTAWGGEFLRVAGAGFERVAHLRPFPLPGGDRAAREPRRAALGVLYELFGADAFDRTDLPPLRAFTDAERAVLRTALARGVNAPLTSAAGRLFDAVAALVGLRQVATFEAQAAAELEWAADETDGEYPFDFAGRVLDWGPAVRAVIGDVCRDECVGRIATRVHNTFAAMIVAVAARAGEPRVALTGGCFQNARLLTLAVGRLQAAGFEPLWHRRVPPNDGGIALGQVIAAARVLREESAGCASPFPEKC